MKLFLKLSLLIFIGFCNCKNRNAHTPKSNIPVSSKWVGGKDGGYWIQIIKIVSNKNIEINIYDENSGELYTNKTYQISADCQELSLDSANLINSINAYDGEKILLKNEGGRNCYLW